LGLRWLLKKPEAVAKLAAHRLDQQAAAVEVYIPVEQRLLHRFAHRLQAGEMDHPGDGPARWRSRRKRPIEISRVADVALHHLQPCLLLWRLQTRKLRHAPQGFGAAVGEVVEHHQVVARFQQHQAGVAADETGAAGHKDGHRRSWCEVLLPVWARWPGGGTEPSTLRSPS